MSADLAAQVADVAHKTLIVEQQGELRFSLPDNFIGLVPSDPIVVDWNGRSERVRIEQCDTLDGYQSYVCPRDLQSTYESVAEGLPSPPAATPRSDVPGPTLIVPLDIPLLMDADDNMGLGFYVAVSGVTAEWSGCRLEISHYFDGTSASDAVLMGTASVIGLLTSELADHSSDDPDDTNDLAVKMLTPGVDLEAATMDGMLEGENLAAVGSPSTGWELINFMTPTEIDPDAQQWTITGMLRGRKYTGTRVHAVGELFVLLNRAALSFEAMSIVDLGREVTLTAVNSDEGSGTVESLVFAGRTQIECPPADVSAERDGTDLLVGWSGVGRLGDGSTTAPGISFAGYRVTINDGTLEGQYDTKLQSMTLPVGPYASPIIVQVAQLNKLTGVGPVTEVTIV